MIITLNKHADKSPTLTCIRDDSSVTWQNYGNQGGFFPVHDLTHYAVETIMGYRFAFWGMIADGRELEDFGSGDAATFHPEAIYAEVLAGLLTTAEGRGSVLTYDEIVETVNIKTAEISITQIALTSVQLLMIRAKAGILVAQWMALTSGETMELTFP